jgi:hypothetical protein
MIKLIFSLLFSFFLVSASAQVAASKNTIISPLDQSPMDMAYFPNNYTILKSQDKVKEAPLARVIFSRPQKNNRTVFGELIDYNTIWRLGANEATEIEFFREVKVGGKKVPKGRYTLYAIPQPGEWIIIINRDTDVWGAFKYDQKKDVARVTVPTIKNAVPVEIFSMDFVRSGNTVNLNIAWDDVSVNVPINL